MSDRCYCGSGKPLAVCCGRFLSGQDNPATAEELMRARYTAHVLKNLDYLRETLWPRYQPAFDASAAALWSENNLWTGLTVVRTTKGGPDDREGTVLFEARFLAVGKLETHRELSQFRKKAGRWYYVGALAD